MEVAGPRSRGSAVGQVELKSGEQPHDAEMGEAPVIMWIGVELERKRGGNANSAVLGQEPSEVFGHPKRLVAVFQHREAENRPEAAAVEPAIDILEGIGQIERQIDARSLFQINAYVLAPAAKKRTRILRVAVVLRSDFQIRPMKFGSAFFNKKKLINTTHVDLIE
jgi:hypothetical protein